MLSFKSWGLLDLWVILIFLSLSYVLAEHSMTIDEEINAMRTKKHCSHCSYCNKQCADYPEMSEDFKTCTLSQLFCCGRKDKCAPFSHRKIPPWGWGLISLAISTLLALFIIWLCVGRLNFFKKCRDELCGCCNNIRLFSHPDNGNRNPSNEYEVIQVQKVESGPNKKAVHHGEFVHSFDEDSNSIRAESYTTMQ